MEYDEWYAAVCRQLVEQLDLDEHTVRGLYEQGLMPEAAADVIVGQAIQSVGSA